MTEIWHNPRCSKSRETLALVEEHGSEVTVRRYLEDAPGLEELKKVQAALGLRAIEMMRPSEAVFKELGLSKTDSDEVLLAAMAVHPVLIERPIVIARGKAVIGRPPENVLEIL